MGWPSRVLPGREASTVNMSAEVVLANVRARERRMMKEIILVDARSLYRGPGSIFSIV
jgi:hypothetical protein